MGTTLNKLEYLDETKSQIKTALNQFNAGITDETTFRDYVDKINDIYDNWEKVTGEGTDLSLNNTKANAKIVLGIKGNGGKNLYNVNDRISSHWTAENVDSEGFIELNFDNTSGSSTIAKDFWTNVSNLIEVSTDYTAIIEFKNVVSSGATLFIASVGGGASQFGVAFNTTNFTTTQARKITSASSFTSSISLLRSYVAINSGGSFSGKVRISLIKGDVTSNIPSYEPYGYKVTGDNTIKVENVNLFNDTNFPKGVVSSVFPTTNMGSYLITLKAGTYYKAVCFDDNTLWTTDISYVFRDNSNASIITTSGTYGFTITEEQAKIITNVQIWTNNNGLTTYANKTTKGMVISKSAIATYTPHQEQTQLISLGTLGLIAGDEIVNVDGKYYINDSTGTEITDETLIEQLDNLPNLKSYTDETNITSTYATGNAPMIISASALKKGGN